MKGEFIIRAILRFPTLECPHLRSLELSHHDYMSRSIPGILLVIPSLESLSCVCYREDPRDLVLEHRNIRDIVLDTTHMSAHPVGTGCKLKRLSFNMPRLVQVEVLESIHRFLVVESTNNVMVKYTRYLDEEGREWIGENVERTWWLVSVLLITRKVSP